MRQSQYIEKSAKFVVVFIHILKPKEALFVQSKNKK